MARPSRIRMGYWAAGVLSIVGGEALELTRIEREQITSAISLRSPDGGNI